MRTEHRKYLFICNYGQSRSKWFAEQFMKKGKLALFCGINELADFRISKHYLEWADIIICLEEYIPKTLHNEAIDYYTNNFDKCRVDFYIDDEPMKFYSKYLELEKNLVRKGLWESI
jgi:predicted protein tyrosine phosphatase